MKVRILYKSSHSETFVSVAQFLVLICFYEGVSASVLRLSGQGCLLPVFHLYAPDSHSGMDSLPGTHACLHSHTHTHPCMHALSLSHTPTHPCHSGQDSGTQPESLPSWDLCFRICSLVCSLPCFLTVPSLLYIGICFS